MELSDEQIKKFRRGDILVFEKIHVNMYQSLCLFGSKIVDDDVVNDTVQEAFIALWDKREELDNIYRIKSYLYTIVKNKLLTYKRLKKTVSFDDMQFIALLVDQKWEYKYNKKIANFIDQLCVEDIDFTASRSLD